MAKPSSQQGLTLVELLASVAIAAVLITGISHAVNTALQAEQASRSHNTTLQQARFAMQRMTRAVSRSQRLFIPLAENAATAWSESTRNVLAVALDPSLDRNKDGWADANNDKDFLDVNQNGTRDTGEPERIDEDTDLDANSDGKPGIYNIDDDGDGTIDEGNGAMARHDDDEDGQTDEDSLNSNDDDGDGSIDEDVFKDMNNDSKSGISLSDDDFDGTVDEGSNEDDDEDGNNNEDWFDQHVFFLNGATLMERLPNIDAADGADYTEYPIASNVSQFQVQRLTGGNPSLLLVDITLTLTPANVAPVTLNTRVGVGGVL